MDPKDRKKFLRKEKGGPDDDSFKDKVPKEEYLSPDQFKFLQKRVIMT